MNIKTKLRIYWLEIKSSRVAWVAAFYSMLEIVALQSEHVRAIVGVKWYPIVMIVCFTIARFRPAKILPPKDQRQ